MSGTAERGLIRAALSLVIVIMLCAGPRQGLSSETLTPAMETQLLKEDPAVLARDARRDGDPVRGAVLFFQPQFGCAKCHVAEGKDLPLGPDLSRPAEKVSDIYLVEAVLTPSKAIRKGFETVTIATKQGQVLTGLVVADRPSELVIRDPAQDFKVLVIDRKDIEDRTVAAKTIMPAGLVNLLGSRQQFLDLVRYLIDISEHGPARANLLRPDPSLYALPPVPEYEKDIDHAGMIAALDAKSLQRGAAIYDRTCVNCHGTKDRPGSLPTSLAFASGKFKNGSDPHSMYRTLTHGFGLMTPQPWMVPQQKYDVIHYIREAYLKPHNSTQYTPVSADYLARLPKGAGRGPTPLSTEPWVTMNYGPNLMSSVEVGASGNFAYKGIAVRLDDGPGGISQGRYWMLYDHDTLRLAAAWSGRGFIDWNGIHFNGKHAVHPRTVGEVQIANASGPGWASPAGRGFEDVRLQGRDGRRYGPLPRSWAHYKGVYHYDNRVILSYAVGDVNVLEMPGLAATSPAAVFTRAFNIGPRTQEMILQVADGEPGSLLKVEKAHGNNGPVAVLGPREKGVVHPQDGTIRFDGATFLEASRPEEFQMTDRDYTITARLKTRQGGTILAQTAPQAEWVHDGKALFVRGGKLVFDIGWVGAVTSKRSINDDQWHNVAMTWEHYTGRVRLYIDGVLDREGKLKPKQPTKGHTVRLGYTAANFPEQSHLEGQLAELRFYQRVLNENELAAPPDSELVAHWQPGNAQGGIVRDETGKGHDARVVAAGSSKARGSVLVAGTGSPVEGAAWLAGPDNQLRLRIPAGEQPLRFSIWMCRLDRTEEVPAVVEAHSRNTPGMDLTPLLRGGPRKWPETLSSVFKVGDGGGPFAIDEVALPDKNPWSCQLRLTGIDFCPDGDRAAICCWDGDVWLLRGLGQAGQRLTWQRIASGLFQPLGIKIVAGNVYVCCRDQIVVLRDLNGDGETDFYENFNSDHQVTEHFHEFAMGLQTDAEGNFYYAKGARHAKTALVPHHGTLLKVSKDGSRTEILATGFRAPNGVCLNLDGTFILTDQEGHWNPKNRINWVRRGGFYGNMWGFHDVEDSSDQAMEQPLCWITNQFDRSPAELLWVESKKWGPLEGSLLNLSYGYGKIFVVPHEKVDGKVQGGMCALPIPSFPTGVMRGRFHPRDGQLYVCGMFAWAGNQQQPGGLYRVRYTGKPVWLPMKVHARAGGLEIQFSEKLDPRSAEHPEHYSVRTWSLKRSANYGSEHYNTKTLQVARARLGEDGRTVMLDIPDIEPTWCMEIRYSLRGVTGEEVNGVIHNTIHALGK